MPSLEIWEMYIQVWSVVYTYPEIWDMYIQQTILTVSFDTCPCSVETDSFKRPRSMAND